jgi:hypothetical protein
LFFALLILPEPRFRLFTDSRRLKSAWYTRRYPRATEASYDAPARGKAVSCERPTPSPWCRRCRRSVIEPTEDEGRVLPAEADAVGHRHVDGTVACGVGDVIEVAVVVRVVEVHRRRHDPVAAFSIARSSGSSTAALPSARRIADASPARKQV